jgi:hypothetical protein
MSRALSPLVISSARNGRETQPSRAMPAFLICCEGHTLPWLDKAWGLSRALTGGFAQDTTPALCASAFSAASHSVALLGGLIVTLFAASRVTAALSPRDHGEPVMPPRAFELHAPAVWRSAHLPN